MSSGGLSLWKFVGRSDVLGVSLPSASISLDSSVLCGGDFQVQIQDFPIPDFPATSAGLCGFRKT